MYVSLSADLDISVNVRWTVELIFFVRTPVGTASGLGAFQILNPSCATTNAASMTTAETKTKKSNETEEKLVYYILFDCSPSDEQACTMTMYCFVYSTKGQCGKGLILQFSTRHAICVHSAD